MTKERSIGRSVDNEKNLESVNALYMDFLGHARAIQAAVDGGDVSEFGNQMLCMFQCLVPKFDEFTGKIFKGLSSEQQAAIVAEALADVLLHDMLNKIDKN